MVRLLTSGFLLLALLAGSAQAQQPDRRMQRLTRWLSSKDESLRLQAVQEIGTLELSKSQPLLLAAIKDPSPGVRGKAAWLLGGHHQANVVAALRPLLKDEDDRVRAATAWALARNAGRAVVPDLVKLAREDVSGVVRFRAVWGLGLIKDKSALPVVIEALGDYNNSVRERSAVIALETLADKDIVTRLLTQKDNILPATRRIVMYLLGKHGGADRAKATAGLQAGLKDADATVRGQAALALGRLKAAAARADLIVALRDSDDHVRGSAAHALGLIGDKVALPDLHKAMQDDSALVRAIAAESLNRLGDRSVTPPEGFVAAELFTYPIHSPEHENLYR